MNRFIFLILFLFYFLLNHAQPANLFQPDIIYKEKKIKKIYIYLNSPKDLSEIIEFDKNGKRIYAEKYDASYNVRTRKLKQLIITTQYIYDSIGRLQQKVNKRSYSNSSSFDNKTIYHYKNGELVLSRYYQRNFDKANSETTYSYYPLTSTTIIKNDSIIVFKNIIEFERDFYEKKSYGFYYEPHLKEGVFNIDDKDIIATFSDYNDLKLFNQNTDIVNIFNKKEQLIKSEVKSIFMNDRTRNYILIYKYYKNGLLKSIKGDGRYFYKYEYFE